MNTLLEKTQQITYIIQKAAGYPISFEEMADTLRKIIGSNVYILGRKGKVLGYAFKEKFYCSIIDEIVKLGGQNVAIFNEDLIKITQTEMKFNSEGICIFDAKKSCMQENKYIIVAPIQGGGQRLGTLLLTKEEEFESNDLILIELGATVVGMEILRARAEKIEEIARQKAVVSIAFTSLSYSELEAIEYIFSELNGNSGLLVASKIADKVGITRSVIVNALRKLESANVIEVKSLGMKGTYINILNDYLMEEINRIKVEHPTI